MSASIPTCFLQFFCNPYMPPSIQRKFFRPPTIAFGGLIVLRSNVPVANAVSVLHSTIADKAHDMLHNCQDNTFIFGRLSLQKYTFLLQRSCCNCQKCNGPYLCCVHPVPYPRHGTVKGYRSDVCTLHVQCHHKTLILSRRVKPSIILGKGHLHCRAIQQVY